MNSLNSFGCAASLRAGDTDYSYFRLATLEEKGVANVSRLPFSTKVLLENLVRCEDGRKVQAADIDYVARGVGGPNPKEINFMPARVLLQDFTGVPAVVDLAAMRDALAAMGADPTRANPLLPADLVIDHSVQVDSFGSKDSFSINALLEFQRNKERYMLLRWGQTAFRNFRVIPPDTGIVHQVNLEYLAPVVFRADNCEGVTVYPDTVVGTDSHTTMINGLGVVGWGVGGIEAEACMLGQPISMLLPPVVGFKLHGRPREGVTATDLVLTVTQLLRAKGVVGKFVEFYGAGLSSLSLADRATVANMAPEYGATIGFFPVDDETLRYLQVSNRDPQLLKLIEAYCKEQGLFRTDDTRDPLFSDSLELDLGTVTPSMAGPKRPQDRVELPDVRKNFSGAFKDATKKSAKTEIDGHPVEFGSGAVVIAAITSCTNTSNPSVMIGAGLLAKKAVERGLTSKPWVKTSLAPGSKVVSEYLDKAGLTPYLEKLSFNLVGYGCTTCIGNSGPLPEAVATAVQKENLVVAAVLSGNRNFEGRINPLVKANYLASPPLVVAYALAGTVDIDLAKDSLGTDTDGKPVYLREIWPTSEEVQTAIRSTIDAEMFRSQYEHAAEGDATWKSLDVPTGSVYQWDDASTYIKKPPYFDQMGDPNKPIEDLSGMRVLALLGDSVTTDHISPAGNIAKESPAGKYLTSLGVMPKDFNSYGARRGNHEVMVRGTLANIRLRNQMAPGTEGGWTQHQPDGEQMYIYDASMKYQSEGVPLLIIAGKEYGSGSSRDWAAKGVMLLGVKAAIAESFERIHRTNLVGMGVLPLQFQPGDTPASLKLSGKEMFSVSGIRQALEGNKIAQVTATANDGKVTTFDVIVRVDTPQEVEYYRHGGILPFVLRQLAGVVAETRPPDIRVVLCQPRNPLNIGAAARAVSNFGFRHLRVVNPYDPAFREAVSAVGGAPVLRAAELHADLADALHDCTLVVGTTAIGHRELQHPLLTLAEAAPLIRDNNGPVALLFGSEKFGLTNEEMAFCHHLAHIPTSPQTPSMNLGQAVAVCLYELIREPAAGAVLQGPKPVDGSDAEQITRMMLEVLRESGYTNRIVATSIELKVRRFIRRIHLTTRDAPLVLGILRQVLWRFREKG